MKGFIKRSQKPVPPPGTIIKNKSKQKAEKRPLSNTKVNEESKDEAETPTKKPRLNNNEKHALQRIKTKKNKETKNSIEYSSNTIFVGNIPIETTKKQLMQHFKKYGRIKSVRIRGIPVADPSTPKKVAAIKKEFHPNRKSLYGFVKFSNPEEAKNAEAENGELFKDFHLRVQSCESKEENDESKAIFVGNLNFDVEEEELWKLFCSCGPISHIRVIRDGLNGIGKGFAYVNFKDTDSTYLALEMGEVTLRNRVLRISRSNINRAKKTRKFKKAMESQIKNDTKNDAANTVEKKFTPKKPKAQFVGRKSNLKNKNKKPSTFAINKKKLAEKLLSSNEKTKKKAVE